MGLDGELLSGFVADAFRIRLRHFLVAAIWQRLVWFLDMVKFLF